MYIEYTSDLEKRFISFMKKTVEGIRKDYYRKETRYRRDEILVIDNRYFTISSNNLLYDDIVDLFSTIEFENQKLLQAFNSLTPQQKKVVTLIVIYDKTEVQTSNILHIAQQTVNAIKKKALEHLKTQMEVI